MARDTNYTVTVGRFTDIPTKKLTQSGKSVVSFTLACNRMDEGADFINFVAWNKTADVICQYCKKGDRILVEGHIQTRNYDGKDGKKVYITEVLVDRVQFLQSRESDKNVPTTHETQQYYNSYQGLNEERYTSDFGSDTLDISQDDLPF